MKNLPKPPRPKKGKKLEKLMKCSILLKDLPLEIRVKQASAPLYLTRYE